VLDAGVAAGAVARGSGAAGRGVATGSAAAGADDSREAAGAGSLSGVGISVWVAAAGSLTTCAVCGSPGVLPPENMYQPPTVAAASTRPAIAMRAGAPPPVRGASFFGASALEKSGRAVSSVRSTFSTS